MFKMPKGPQFPDDPEILALIVGILVGLIVIYSPIRQAIIELDKQLKPPTYPEQTNQE